MESDSNEEYINDEEYNSRIAKTSKVSCLNCRTYHKKCIGGRPCDYCKSKNIECLENHKRKATGRPKKKGEEKTEPKKDNKKVVQEIPKKIKTKVGEDIAKIGQNNDPQSQIVRMEPNNHQINPTHIQINALMSANQKICDKCNSTQEMSAKFCNKCGNRLPELIILQNDNLLKEIEFLRKKNMELNNFIQMRMFSPTNMWMLTKLAVPSPKFTYPLASYILESSPAFLNLLGYKDLTNVFYPDMFPQEHHKMLSSKNFFIKVERIEGMLVPKYSFKDDVYMRHSSGTFIHLLLNATMYFDNITRLPSMRVVHVEKVFQLNVKKEELPLHNPPTDSTYYCGLDDEIPEIIKKFNPNYGAPTFNNIIKRDVFLNVPPENTVNPSNIFGTIDIPNFDPNTLSFGGGFNNNQSNYF